VFCDGADRAVVLNGLPEMPIRDMVLENVTVLSKRGATIADADGVRLENCRIEPRTGPVLHVIQSRNVTVSGGPAPADSTVFLRVTGAGSESIRIRGIGFGGDGPSIETDGGASPAAVIRE
jgi:hypothetical protein